MVGHDHIQRLYRFHRTRQRSRHIAACVQLSMSARALLYIILGHTEHHLSVLNDRYGVR